MTGQYGPFLESLRAQLRPVFLHLGVLSFFLNLLILPVSLYSLQVLDRVMSTGSLATLFWLTVIMIVFFIASGMLQTLRSTMLQGVGDWLHQELAQRILPLALGQLALMPGAKGVQGLRDASTMKQFVAGNALASLFDAPWSLLYVAVLFVIHPFLGMLVVAGAATLIVLAVLNEVLIRVPVKKASQLHIQNMQEFEMASRNADIISAMGMAPSIIARWQAKQTDIKALQAESGGRSACIQGITKFVRLTLQILVTALSAWLALSGHVTMGAIIASSILSSRALAPFEASITSWKSLTEARAALERLSKIVEIKPRVDGISLPVPRGSVSSEKVSFIMPGTQQMILKDIHFGAKAGEIIGIIGPSGSGKTTLAKLIAGIYAPSAGIIRLDGANVYTWPREEYGRFTGYLPQDIELFSGSVKENIARLDKNAPDEFVIEAAQLANAHELILRLPNGYETDIGSNGANLSAGQRQRIGLARALYGKPRLLILDEPDASLDDAGRNALVLALKQAKLQGITCFIVTHRKSILACTDRILRLRNGMVEGFAETQQVAATLGATLPMETA